MNDNKEKGRSKVGDLTKFKIVVDVEDGNGGKEKPKYGLTEDEKKGYLIQVGCFLAEWIIEEDYFEDFHAFKGYAILCTGIPWEHIFLSIAHIGALPKNRRDSEAVIQMQHVILEHVSCQMEVMKDE